MQINSAIDLDVYKKAYVLAMKIFELSKTFPAEEKFALTGQIRRSSATERMLKRKRRSISRGIVVTLQISNMQSSRCSVETLDESSEK